jgi:hypothetical protein
VQPPAAEQPPAAGIVAAPASEISEAGPSVAAESEVGDGAAAAALIAAYKRAHANKDVEAMLSLYWFSTADEEMRQTIRENVVAAMRCPLVDVKVEPVDPAEHGPREEGGVRWGRSLPVIALLTANFDTSQAPVGGYHTQQARIMVGRRGGRYYFVVPLRE